MKKQTKKTKPAKAAKKAAPKAKAKKTTRARIPPILPPVADLAKSIIRDAQRKAEQAAKELPPPPPTVPTANQDWRKKIDWVAAGKKAHETRMRNLAAKNGGQAPAPKLSAADRRAVAMGFKRTPAAPVTPPVQQRKAPAGKPSRAPLSEGDTSRA